MRLDVEREVKKVVGAAVEKAINEVVEKAAEQGKNEAKTEMIMNCHRNGLDISTIAKIVLLSEIEIENIIKAHS